MKDTRSLMQRGHVSFTFFFHFFILSLALSLIHSFVYVVVDSLIHLLVCSFINPLVHLSICSLTLINSFAQSLTHLLTHLHTHLLIHSLTHPCTHSLTQPLTHSIQSILTVQSYQRLAISHWLVILRRCKQTKRQFLKSSFRNLA